jgi:hypothetical protein
MGTVILGKIFLKNASKHTKIEASHIVHTTAFNNPNSKPLSTNHGNKRPRPCKKIRLKATNKTAIVYFFNLPIKIESKI